MRRSFITTSRHNGTLRSAIQKALRHRKIVPAALVFSALAGNVAPALAEPFPAVFELSSLAGGDGTAGFIINGIDSQDNSGRAVSDAGDINGDGLSDIIIGAYNADPQGRSAAGQSYVVFGASEGFPPAFELSSLIAENGGDGTLGFAITGDNPADFSGFSVSAAGDVNSDGIDDLIVGAFGADVDGDSAAGRAYIVFGTDQGFAAEFALASLMAENGGDGSTGFVLGGDGEFTRAGGSVSAAGDINDDGIDDVVVGAVGADPGARIDAGRAYVVFGSSKSFAPQLPLSDLLSEYGGDGSEGFVINGIDTYDEAGRSASSAGDVNGDGINDLIVGAPHANGDAGESYVVFGSNVGFPPEFELSTLLAANGGDGSQGFVMPGAGFEDYSGTQVSSAGDFNGDGIDDIIVGAPRANAGSNNDDAGVSYVVLGARNGFAAELPLSSLLAANGGDGSKGVAIKGAEFASQTGFSVSSAGDINGDKIDDLVVGGPEAGYGFGSNYYAGESFVIFGTQQALEAEVSLLDVLAGDGSAGFSLRGFSTYGRSGISVSAAGDLNGDGLDDVIVGAHMARPHGNGNAGQSYVVFGRSGDADSDGVTNTADNCLLLANPDQNDADNDGFGTRCDADFNNDCAVNFVDLGQMKGAFFGANPLQDLDGSGEVNFGDLAIMKSVFFAAPGPSGITSDCSASAPPGR